MDEKINRETIIKNISLKSDYNSFEIKNFMDIIISKFKDFLKERDRIEIRGLGTFYTKEHKGRYVQLKTKIIDSKNHYVTLFKPSKALQLLVNREDKKYDS